MKRFSLISAPILGALCGVACTTVGPSLPPGYNGPTAEIRDSATVRNRSDADFFYVANIDGNAIEQSLNKTIAENHGQGFNMVPKIVQRTVPARSMTIELVGRTHHAAPIQSLFSSEYEVNGPLTFTPEAEHTYIVHGELGEHYSAVWLEDLNLGTLVGQKIEIHEPAAPGSAPK
jgi:hypothetical protein